MPGATGRAQPTTGPPGGPIDKGGLTEMVANSLYDARPGGARVDRLRLRTDPSAYDPDDMFGVRRALAVLPTEAHDRFFDRWVVLTEDADYDVRRIHAAVRVERAAPASDGLGPAWVSVDDAITAYLGWRSAR